MLQQQVVQLLALVQKGAGGMAVACLVAARQRL